MKSSALNKRLDGVVERLKRHLTTFKLFKVKNIYEQKSIIDKEYLESSKSGGVFDVSNLLIFIDVGGYHGAKRKKN